MALVGMGRFGKSQLAIHLTHHVHEESPLTSIFWVHGASKATFEASYRRIAEALLLPRRTDAEIDLMALVRDWLQKVNGSHFLMAIDNPDDTKAYFGGVEDSEGLALYLPNCNYSKVLVTTQIRDIAKKLSGNGKWI
ncbi:hypothetical protein B0I35DRAFT_479012 [Stachybotrys elegans]|uniref:NB-ARC domain-containing protein n=1 Tax=Stachybotrys elegans TaxID=80388 RepID=A0A8K0SM97_9HYPO|nr:hypothetical protein B0I35DRAFT_479012 [Stachybotrys elegans]